MKKSAVEPPFHWWSFLPSLDPGPWRAVHRFNAAEVWRRSSTLRERAVLVAQSLRWFPDAFLQMRHRSRKFGRSVYRQSGKPVWRQQIEQLGLAWLRGISPKSYYLFELHRPDRRRLGARYLHRYETKRAGVYRALARRRGGSMHALNNKNHFQRRCQEAGIETVPVVLVASRGGVRAAAGYAADSLPAVDLFSKPLRGRGGSGTESLRCIAPGLYEDSRGGRHSSAEILTAWRRESRSTALLVQPRMTNHPELADLAGRVFSTARVLSILDEQGHPVLAAASFRMACGSPLVDNLHRGGLAAPIDLASGELGRAVRLRPGSERVAHHPQNGARILGRRLPSWPAACDLVRRAHAAFPEALIVGWDVGFTANGPILVEGNSAPCVHLVQRPQDAPLGDTRFGELLAHHIRVLGSRPVLEGRRTRAPSPRWH